MKVFAIFLAFMFSVGLQAKTINPTNAKEFKQASVMVTNKATTSGGTGVIYKSTPTKSFILTNSHVCGVISEGGLVITSDKKYTIEFYKQSQIHDLCLVQVMADLGVNTELASKAPEFGEPITVSGFPLLMPLQIVNGMMSESMEVTLMIGLTPCTQADLDKINKDNPSMEDLEFLLMCAFFGGQPVYKTFNTMTTSALISPGNSGSAVYNKDGEIVALVFAGGGGDVTQGILVPLEYIKNFIEKEASTLSWKNANSPIKASDLRNKYKTGTYKLKRVNKESLNNIKFPAVKDLKINEISSKIEMCQKGLPPCEVK